MTPRAYLLTFCAAVAIVTAVSCGDIPSLPSNIAYTTPILLPMPAVEADSFLHDSTGAVAPLRVRAYDQAGTEILGVPVTYVVLTLPPKLTIAADGTVRAADTVMTVQIAAQVGGFMQTPAATLYIAPHPTAFARGGSDTAFTLPNIKPLPVTVTGTWHNTTLPVPGVLLRYAVSAVYPASAAGSVVLALPVDTTDISGNATRNLAVGTGVDSVIVLATALDFNAKPIPGSPLRFVFVSRP
jgi:hypothetical protein